MTQATTDTSANAVRQQFVDFFVAKHGHQNIASSPVVPHNDPTLLFANAGMNQFKPYFLGTETPPTPPRVANTQKCIRAGGKHNDLDDVGKDTYHHTFFEMLGNWSFGDYFKAEAIDWAWELLTEVWGLPADRLYATYFQGDDAEGLEPDHEARELWERHLPPDRVLPGNKKDNFWEMGDTGPCGPCSEIHYDGRPAPGSGESLRPGNELVNQDHPNVIEVWNLVFIQFNRNTDGSLVSLPAKHVDTGMGFERIVRVLQDKDSNYDTDVFTPLFDAIQTVTGARAYTAGGQDEALNDPINIAYRVIADHIRCLTFALADGAHCGNKGRDAVLRTILRRAVRFGHQQLGVEQPFFHKLVPAVVEHMGDAFPEIRKNPEAIMKELEDEEVGFRQTLSRGIRIFDHAVDELAGKELPGDTAFDLEATYGFPISLTQVMAEERGLTVDMPGYEKAKAEHADISRAGGATDSDLKARLTELVQQHNLPDTEFLGYDTVEHTATQSVRAFPLGDRLAVVTDKTPFYGEQGGQVGDTGTMTINAHTHRVLDTQKIGGVFFHICEPNPQAQADSSAVEREVTLSVDPARRARIQANHTTTHVLNRALRDLVNTEADQKGSLVDDEKLRFDFSNPGPVKGEQLEAVEEQVNRDIASDLAVHTAVVPQEKALEINGLRAVFGEKYPPEVRVVSIGTPVRDLLADPASDKWTDKSIEFCGGTHLSKTGDAEGFVIVSEENVAKGIRRITGLTGDAANKAQAEAERLLHRAEALQSVDVEQLAAELDAMVKAVEGATLPVVLRTRLQAVIAELSSKLKTYRKQQSDAWAGAVIDAARALAEQALANHGAGIDGQSANLIVADIPGADGKTLRQAMEVLKKKCPDAAMFLAAGDEAEGKVALLAAVPEARIKAGFKAGDWVKHVAPIVGGGGGGRPDMAQAGGKDPAKLNEALEAARAFAAEKLG